MDVTRREGLGISLNLQGWRIIAIALAITIAFTAQYLFTGEIFTRFRDSNTWNWLPKYSIATLLLFVSAAFAGWGVSGTTVPGTLEGEGAGQRGLSSVSLRFLLGAGVCYAGGLSSFLIWGESIWTRLLWVSSVGLIIIPLWVEKRKSGGVPADEIARWEWPVVAVCTGIGFVLRYWRLTDLPSGMDNDIPFMGTFGLKLIRNSNFNWIGFSQSGHLLSYDQTIAWGMRLFGEDHYGLVMFSCLSGTLTLPLVYLLGRELFNRRVGLVAMALLAVNYTHIHFSRILFGPSVTLFAVLALYMLVKGLRLRQAFWFSLSGAAMGFGLLTYDSGRVVPVLLIVIAAWEWLWRRENFRSQLQNWAVLVFAALAAFGPMLGFMLKDFHSFMGRGNTVALWTPEVWRHEMLVYKASNALGVIIGQIRATFLTLHLFGDSSPHFAFPRPMVAPLTAALFMVGVSFCILKQKRVQCLVPLAWIFLTFVLGGVITYDPPYWPHLNITLPAIVLVAAVGADKTVEVIAARGRGIVTAWAVIALGILITGIFNWQAYYDYADDNAGYKLIAVRYINSLPDGYQVYLMSKQYSWNQHAFRFFNRDVPGQDIAIETLRASPPEITRPTLFLVYDQPQALGLLEKLYPNGKLREHKNNEDRVLVMSYDVVPDGWAPPLQQEPPGRFGLPGWWIIGGMLSLIVLLNSKVLFRGMHQ